MSRASQDEDLAQDSFEAFLADARERATAEAPRSVTIRGLLRKVGAERRGARVLAQIRDALDRHGLVTEPDLASGWVDNRVELRLATTREALSASERGAVDSSGTSTAHEVALTVRDLQSATSGVVGVDQTSDLLRARTVMLRHDYSQLAVTSGPRQLVGAVSWTSVALAAIRSNDLTLRDATIPARSVGLDEDLIKLIPTIAEEGFVFVINQDRTPAGIVTTADLSCQLATLAWPFLILGEIERRLRQILSGHFDATELAEVRHPANTHRTIDSANDLTLGEMQRILEKRSRWDRLTWPIERTEFVEALSEVRDIRNEVMHFSPDPLTELQQRSLVNFISWLRAMEPSR
jgi:predicted transcriptional regulator